MQAFYQDVVHLQVAFGHDLLYFKHLELMILGLRIVLRTCIVLLVSSMYKWAVF